MRRAQRSWWFTGSNMFDAFITTQPPTERKELYERNHGPLPPIGQAYTRTYDSEDGNPGRPVRVADLQDYCGQICWLAFCSGPALRREGHKVNPPLRPMEGVH